MASTLDFNSSDLVPGSNLLSFEEAPERLRLVDGYGSGTWTKTSAPNAGWYGIASDSTGRYLAAVVFGGGIYVNNNYGSDTWTQTSAPNAAWTRIVSDSTGRYLAAVVWEGGGIYVNSNYGSGAWTQTSAPSAYWQGIASDSTGRYLAAVDYNGAGIYVNNNYGSGSWIQTSAPNAHWLRITSDSTGRYLAAIDHAGGGIYVNSMYGSDTWTQTSAPNTNWQDIASDSTGMYLAAVVWGGGIYVNSNYGFGSWTQTSAPNPDYWIGIASDSTGRYLAAVVYHAGGIYVNSNFGSGSWTQTSAPNAGWYGIASDSTGRYLAAVHNGGGIYTNGLMPSQTADPTAEPTATPTAEPTAPLTVTATVIPTDGFECLRGYRYVQAECIPCPLGYSTVQGGDHCIPLNTVSILNEKKCRGYKSIWNNLPADSVSIRYMSNTEEKMLVFSNVPSSFFNTVFTVEARFMISHQKVPVGGNNFPNVFSKKQDYYDKRYLLAVPSYAGQTSFDLSFPSCIDHLLKPGQFISKLRLIFYGVSQESMLTFDTIVGCKDYYLDPSTLFDTQLQSEGGNSC